MSRSLILAMVSFATLTACGVDSSTDTSSTQEALVEAEASAADAKATADACFSAFDTCRDADGADVEQCKADLKECLPAEAHPGPRCGPPRGKGKGSPHGPNGDQCDGGARPAQGGEQGGQQGQPPPPPKDGEEGAGDRPPPPEGGEQGGQGQGAGGPPPGGPRGDGGGEPGFCKKVPLPPPAELKACREALDTCVDGDGDRKACFDAHHTCVKAAFDAAKSSASTAAE